MTVTLNGKPVELPDHIAIAQLLEDREVEASHVVVEINHAIVDRDHFAETSLSDGDRIEILRFVGGG